MRPHIKAPHFAGFSNSKEALALWTIKTPTLFSPPGFRLWVLARLLAKLLRESIGMRKNSEIPNKNRFFFTIIEPLRQTDTNNFNNSALIHNKTEHSLSFTDFFDIVVN